jgi:hypothetical protein
VEGLPGVETGSETGNAEAGSAAIARAIVAFGGGLMGGDWAGGAAGATACGDGTACGRPHSLQKRAPACRGFPQNMHQRLDETVGASFMASASPSDQALTGLPHWLQKRASGARSLPQRMQALEAGAPQA